MINEKNNLKMFIRNLSGGIVSIHTGWKFNDKKINTLFKLGRKLAKSDILNIVSKFKKPPIAIKFYFNSFIFFFKNNKINLIK